MMVDQNDIACDPHALCKCANCGHTTVQQDLDFISDLGERLDAGCEVPAGQCPKCGALAYLVKGDKPAPALEDLANLIADNLDAWEGEEDSVKTEHADLISQLQREHMTLIKQLTSPAAPTDYIAALERLWDALSDTIEGGRISEVDCPDDYQALVTLMRECESARDKAGWPVRKAPAPRYSVCFDIDGHGEGREYNTPEEAAQDVAQYVRNLFETGADPESHCLTFGREDVARG